MRLLTSINKFGLKRVFQTCISILDDYYYDHKYGIDTFEKGNVVGEDPDSIEDAFYFRYQPTRFRHFRKLMRQMPFPKDAVFVDVGSGKGKVLLMAYEFGFKRIRGVELSEDLCEIARKNIQVYEQKRHVNLPVEVFVSDILDYSFKDDEQIFYFFNPFDETIMNQFVLYLKASMKKNPRNIWLIFNNFKNPEIFNNDDLFKKRLYYVYAGTHFTVLVHK